MILENAATLEATPHLDTSEIRLTKLLAAVDFSVQTPPVMEAAISIAHSFGSEVIVVNAATSVTHGTGMEPVPIETFDVNLDIAKVPDGSPGLQFA